MADTKEIFKGKVTILLSEKSDPNASNIEIQDFVENGKPFIPVFSSLEALKESTQGAALPFPTFNIDGLFLIGLLKGNEIIRLNPNLKDESFYIASALKEEFKVEIENLFKKLNKNPASNS